MAARRGREGGRPAAEARVLLPRGPRKRSSAQRRPRARTGDSLARLPGSPNPPPEPRLRRRRPRHFLSPRSPSSLRMGASVKRGTQECPRKDSSWRQSWAKREHCVAGRQKNRLSLKEGPRRHVHCLIQQGRGRSTCEELKRDQRIRGAACAVEPLAHCSGPRQDHDQRRRASLSG